MGDSHAIAFMFRRIGVSHLRFIKLTKNLAVLTKILISEMQLRLKTQFLNYLKGKKQHEFAHNYYGISGKCSV